jgi:hypothetical protein
MPQPKKKATKRPWQLRRKGETESAHLSRLKGTNWERDPYARANTTWERTNKIVVQLKKSMAERKAKKASKKLASERQAEKKKRGYSSSWRGAVMKSRKQSGSSSTKVTWDGDN